MKKNNQKPRLKIIRHRPYLGGLNIASRHEVLWPCHAFEVSIPIEKQDLLNIFELTVLKLSLIVSSDTATLAQLTCLDTDLVSFVQQRLYQLDLLTERFVPTQHAKDLLEQWDEAPPKYETATVYYDLLAGRLLPIATTKPFKTEHITRHLDKTDTVVFTWGKKGKQKSVKAQYLAPRSTYFHKAVMPEEVVNAIKAFKVLNQRFSVLGGRLPALPDFILSANAITIADKPALVHLCCEVVMQKGSDELLVSDAFGYGCYSGFKQSLDAMNDDWLLEVKEKALRKTYDLDQQNKIQAIPGGFNQHINACPQIAGQIKRANEHYLTFKSLDVGTAYKQKQATDAIEKTLKALYEVIEWTLRQVVFDNPADQWIGIFSAQSVDENQALLGGFAQKLGFKVTEYTLKRMQVSEAKFRAYKEGTAEIQSLLALSLARAQQDSLHPVNRLAETDPSCLGFIFELKRWRDAVAHGELLDQDKIMQVTDYQCGNCDYEERAKARPDVCPHCNGKTFKVKTTEFDDYKQRVWTFVQTLYPHFKCTDERSETVRSDSRADNIEQQILKANIELERRFGMNEIKLMSSRLVDQLRKGEMQLSQQIDAIGALASALEIALIETIGKGNRTHADGRTVKSTALDNLKAAGFTLTDGELPKRLSTVGNKKITKAATGISTSLGANMLVFACRATAEQLALWARKLPDLILNIDTLLKLRGHSNEQLIDPLTDSDLKVLKNQLYHFIKLLMDTQNG
jgi:hypothetical protein